MTQKDYLKIAETVAKNSTCLRRNYGAILVKNDEIIATGYNGSPRGSVNCNESGECIRDVMNINKGDNYDMCASVHAEMNCMISASRESMIGSTIFIVGLECSPRLSSMYASGQPCLLCHRMLVNAGVSKCYAFKGYRDAPEIESFDISAASFDFRMIDKYKTFSKSIENDVTLSDKHKEINDSVNKRESILGINHPDEMQKHIQIEFD